MIFSEYGCTHHKRRVLELCRKTHYPIHRLTQYPSANTLSTCSRTIQSPLLASQGLSPNGTNEEVKLARSSQLDVRARRDAKFLVLNISSSWKCLYYMFITCQRISFIDDKNAFIIKLFHAQR